MDLEKRMENLEKLVTSMMNSQTKRQFYTDADIASVDKKVTDITPYTQTKTAYIDDTEIIFENVPRGNLTVYFDGNYTIEREGDRVIIMFEPLEEVKEVTISII